MRLIKNLCNKLLLCMLIEKIKLIKIIIYIQNLIAIAQFVNVNK